MTGWERTVSITCGSRACLIGALLFSTLTGPVHGSPRYDSKSKPTPEPSLSGDIEFAVVPTVSIDLPACPNVATPKATVARFSLWPLPRIAAVVDVGEMQRLVVSRVGGLYGP